MNHTIRKMSGLGTAGLTLALLIWSGADAGQTDTRMARPDGAQPKAAAESTPQAAKTTPSAATQQSAADRAPRHLHGPVPGPARRDLLDEPIPAEIHSPDPAQRARALFSFPRRFTPERERLLEGLIADDADSYVRERAVFALAEMLGPKARGKLRKIAIETVNDTVRQAALAHLSLLDRTHPRPPRSRVALELEKRIQPGTPFRVTVRFASDRDVPRARLTLQARRGLKLLSPESNRWKGQMRAGQERAMGFTLLLDPSVKRIEIEVRVDFDHAARFDVEERRARAFLAVVDGQVKVLTGDQMPRDRVIHIEHEGK